MKYSIQKISELISCKAIIHSNNEIEHLLIDSRKIANASSSLFFALPGPRRDGHDFIEEVYNRGVRNFVVLNDFNYSNYTETNFIVVNNVLTALQEFASTYRSQFTYPVIGITGSNGKTIVKEWLNLLLQSDFNIVRSPRSYNSQIGVPLSVCLMNASHTLGIFEAGISTVNEMDNLQNIIQPNIGILTNLGSAHSNGFKNDEEKIIEKIKLFKNSKVIISNGDNELVNDVLEKTYTSKILYWGSGSNCNLQIKSYHKLNNQTTISAEFEGIDLKFTVPFTDDASIQNACSCWAILLYLKIEINEIQSRMLQLHHVEMRMQLLPIINNCVLINDSYSNDISSFFIALDYLNTNAGNKKKTIIISDFSGIEKTNLEVYKSLIRNIKSRNIHRVIGIGEIISEFENDFKVEHIDTRFFKSTDEFLSSINSNHFKDEYILLKGGRAFNFERISLWLQQKSHQTVMEINLTAIVSNLKEYQKHLHPTTKVMAMVKAFSYGSGSIEIAKVLQFNKVDYLAVAYTDEGIDLRKAGISLPILILNVEEENFDTLIEYNLEPEIFSFNIYHQFNNYLKSQAIHDFPVHIKVNTGMNRLGFDEDEIENLVKEISTNKTMIIKSVLSHLVASEDSSDDNFTTHQINLFEKICNQIENSIGYSFTKHIANSAAILRHTNSQFDMVRLGIGLYGVNSSNQFQLQTVASLKTTIAQIRKVKATETIGYNRKGVLTKDSIIATVRIGYSDGYNRILSNKKGSMYLHGKLAPIIGNICMDMTMIDITDIPEAKENDVVEVFGKNLPVQQVATWCNTIAYETLSTISQRVRRIYIEE